MVNLFEPGQEHYSINPAQHLQAYQEKMLDGEHYSANRRGEQMNQAKKPEAQERVLTADEIRFLDEYAEGVRFFKLCYADLLRKTKRMIAQEIMLRSRSAGTC